MKMKIAKIALFSELSIIIESWQQGRVNMQECLDPSWLRTPFSKAKMPGLFSKRIWTLWICFPRKPGPHSSSWGVQLSPDLQQITRLVHTGILWPGPPRTRYILTGCLSTAFVSREQSSASTGSGVWQGSLWAAQPLLSLIHLCPSMSNISLNSHPEICLKSRTVHPGKFSELLLYF